jgi:integrase
VALRKNELRLLRVGDLDLAKGTFTIHGKGGKIVVMPIAFDDEDFSEYLIYPRSDPTRHSIRRASTAGSSAA